MENSNIPALGLTPLTERDGEQICEWHYPAPYDLFRWPAWESMVRHAREFGDSQIRTEQYLAVRNTVNEQLVGYVQFFPMDRTLRIGMGLRPDCCDKGWGTALMGIVIDEARRRQPGAEIDLEVEKWNKRAIRVYEKSGFVITDEYERRASHGIVHVLCMVWHNQ